jgi:hypothetical protein
MKTEFFDAQNSIVIKTFDELIYLYKDSFVMAEKKAWKVIADPIFNLDTNTLTIWLKVEMEY